MGRFLFLFDARISLSHRLEDGEQEWEGFFFYLMQGYHCHTDWKMESKNGKVSFLFDARISLSHRLSLYRYQTWIFTVLSMSMLSMRMGGQPEFYSFQFILDIEDTVSVCRYEDGWPTRIL